MKATPRPSLTRCFARLCQRARERRAREAAELAGQAEPTPVAPPGADIRPETVGRREERSTRTPRKRRGGRLV